MQKLRALTPDIVTGVIPSPLSFLFMLPSPNEHSNVRRHAKATRTLGLRMAIVSEGWPKHKVADMTRQLFILHSTLSYNAVGRALRHEAHKRCMSPTIFTQTHIRFCFMANGFVQGHAPVPAP